MTVTEELEHFAEPEFVDPDAAWPDEYADPTVDSLDAAGIAAKRYRAARRVLDANAVQADRWREEALREIDVWEEHASRRALHTIVTIGPALQAFALAYRKDTKKATLILPTLRVPTTETQEHIEIADTAAAAAWALEHAPELLLEVKPREISKTAVKAAIKISDGRAVFVEDGEFAPDWVTVVPTETKANEIKVNP